MIKKQTLFNIFVCIILVLDFLINCLPQFSLYINIITVLLVSIAILMIFCKEGLSLRFLFLCMMDVLIIAITRDVSNVSLLVFISLLFMGNKYYTSGTKKILFFTSLITLTCIVLLYYCFGFNKQYDGTIWRPILGENLARKSMGFTHPNQFMIRFFVTFVLGIISFKHKIITSILFLIGAFIFNNETESRTVFYIILVVTLFLAVLRLFRINYEKNVKRKFQLLLSFSFIILLIFSIAMSLLFANTIIDTYFSGRLAINKSFLEIGISLFGNSELSNQTFDNSYIHMLLTSGLIYILIYSFVWTYYFYSIKSIKFINAILLIALFALAFMEVCMLKYSIMILIMVMAYDGSEKKEILYVQNTEIRASSILDVRS